MRIKSPSGFAHQVESQTYQGRGDTETERAKTALYPTGPAGNKQDQTGNPDKLRKRRLAGGILEPFPVTPVPLPLFPPISKLIPFSATHGQRDCIGQ